MSINHLSRHLALPVAVAALFLASGPVHAQNLAVATGLSTGLEPNRANWALANRFTPEALRPFLYSTSVQARFINDTDTFWYMWRNRDGVTFTIVDPGAKSKKPLFDTADMAGKLSEALKKPFDITNFPVTTVTFSKDAKTISFTVETTRFEYNLETQALKNLGKAPASAVDAPPTQGQGRGGRGGGNRQGPPSGVRPTDAFRNFSPDRKAYVYAQDHNLYFVDVADEKNPVQLTKDGVENYSFGARGQGGQFQQQQQQQQQQEEQQQKVGDTGKAAAPEVRVRANVTWSKDSKAFFVQRSDSRKLADLFLVNSLSEPRPTLTTYKYAMPGEENVSQQELYGFTRDDKKFSRLKVDKWKDQHLFDINWEEGSSTKIRFVRRDRLQRNLEFVEMDLTSGAIQTMVAESVENAFLESQNARYVKPGGDMVWWSERTGWGHLYLYDHAGKLKNVVTSGAWRVEGVTGIDEKKGQLWFTATGREPGENPYYTHLYRVNLNGTDLTLLDAGDADHGATLSTSRAFSVDNFSRADMAPKAVVRDGKGKVVMDLEEMDLSRLQETGWKMPDTFSVKGADGVTDIYGVMWKPFDFDPTKRYPIIANVYPGPQTESVTSTFSATAANQRLAQLGFIVIQIGNRGGNPKRSNAYHSYGYYNLRDYGLADKKAGIEELAMLHPWVDIDKVGIYGHSGGGFMTAAALMLPPYNTFFKVGVSSSGNHDNNVYNQNWSEQHHGLKEVRELKDGAFVSKFEIKVPTNAELAENLKGNLLLVHGDMDNNVHPAGTIRLVNALIKANKRFDLMIMPGKPHGYGDMQGYFTNRMFEYFCEHLLGDYYGRNADMIGK